MYITHHVPFTTTPAYILLTSSFKKTETLLDTRLENHRNNILS